MTAMTISNDELHVALTRAEKVAGFHGDVRVPLTAVRDVRVEADALGAVRGIRAPGYSLPGRTKIGTWRGRGRRTFVVARRDVPAVRLSLSGAKFDELILSTPDADAIAATVRARAGLR
jgi:uncharacterized protein